MINKDDLIMEWITIKGQIANLRENESAIRQTLINNFFTYDNNTQGTFNHDLGNGYGLKAVFKFNYKLDAKTIENTYNSIEALDEEGAYVAAKLIEYEPKLNLKEYKKLEKRYEDILNNSLTVTRATPTLEFVQPKETK
jgi:hypothetical protein